LTLALYPTITLENKYSNTTVGMFSKQAIHFLLLFLWAVDVQNKKKKKNIEIGKKLKTQKPPGV